MVAALSRKVLAVLATSAQSEWLLSKARQIFINRRGSLESENVESQLILQQLRTTTWPPGRSRGRRQRDISRSSKASMHLDRSQPAGRRDNPCPSNKLLICGFLWFLMVLISAYYSYGAHSLGVRCDHFPIIIDWVLSLSCHEVVFSLLPFLVGVTINPWYNRSEGIRPLLLYIRVK